MNRRWRHATTLLALTTALVVWIVPPAGAATTSVTPLLLARVPASSTIYVVDSVTCAKGPCLGLERTNNGGATFTARTLPKIGHVRGVPTGTLDALTFANQSDGYALLGANVPKSLYVTTNGAKSWHEVTAAKGVTIVSLTPTATSLYGIAATCHTTKRTHSCQNFRLARAPLTASTWTFETLPGLSLQGGFFATDVAASGGSVWISSQSTRSLITSSSNAGVSWTTHTAAPLASVSGCALTAMSTSDLWAACPTGMLESFFVSTDAGATWQALHGKPFAGTGGGYFDPVSSSLAYLDYGAKKPLVRLSDHGRTSTTLGPISCSTANASVRALAFSSKRDGLAICVPNVGNVTGRLEATSDAGVMWHQVELSAH